MLVQFRPQADAPGWCCGHLHSSWIFCPWYVSSCVYCQSTWRKGEMGFLRAFSFLFFRFRPGTFWYASVLLARNTGMALANGGCTTRPSSSLCWLSILLPCTVISAVIHSLARKNWPACVTWTTNGSFVLVVFLGALFKNVDDKSLIGDVLMAICVILASVFLIVIFQTVNMFYTRRGGGSATSFFLCHHKDGAGSPSVGCSRCFFRTARNVERRSFWIRTTCRTSSDCLALLPTVFGTLVVLCSKEILQRPWCVGEMCTARENTIDTIMVCFPNFVWPSDLFIDRLCGTRWGNPRFGLLWASVWTWFERHSTGCARVRELSCPDERRSPPCSLWPTSSSKTTRWQHGASERRWHAHGRCGGLPERCGESGVRVGEQVFLNIACKTKLPMCRFPKAAWWCP